MSHIHDLMGIIRGLQKVLEAGIKLQDAQFKLLCKNSSLKGVPSNIMSSCKAPSTNLSIGNIMNESIDRMSVVLSGMKNYTVVPASTEAYTLERPVEYLEIDVVKDEIEELNREFNKTFQKLNQKAAEIESAPQIQEDENKVEKINKLFDEKMQQTDHEQPYHKTVSVDSFSSGSASFASEKHTKAKPYVKPKVKQTLSETSKQRVVPSSRIGRMISFGSLAAGLGVGTLAQYARNTVQSVTGQDNPSSNIFMSTANAERIVDTLCKVRGAALKLGQLLSLQDENIISPELQKVFERVRQSADFMPTWQVEKVLSSQLGADWREKVKSFEDKPFAAASIGQVHLAVLHDGTEVAMKIQYPGVAKGINSDIDNLVGVMKVWNVFPRGMFIDNVVEVAKKELSWEVDYKREAACTKQFKELLKPYPEYFVPRIIDELSSSEVITSELIEGVPIDKCFVMDSETRHCIAYMVMQLVIREMFVLRCMQTDPNWANFFWDANTQKLVLLDFGATREYSKEFMDQYIQIIKAASVGDRSTILRMSKEMKFLTGYESKIMEETHVDTVMILGEVFASKNSEGFDFSTQNTTKRIQHLVPTLLDHRLCPPPEEIYSLHRKLSGVFLLCSKLKVKMDCRKMFNEIYDKYEFGTSGQNGPTSL